MSRHLWPLDMRPIRLSRSSPRPLRDGSDRRHLFPEPIRYFATFLKTKKGGEGAESRNCNLLDVTIHHTDTSWPRRGRIPRISKSPSAVILETRGRVCIGVPTKPTPVERNMSNQSKDHPRVFRHPILPSKVWLAKRDKPRKPKTEKSTRLALLTPLHADPSQPCETLKTSRRPSTPTCCSCCQPYTAKVVCVLVCTECTSEPSQNFRLFLYPVTHYLACRLMSCISLFTPLRIDLLAPGIPPSRDMSPFFTSWPPPPNLVFTSILRAFVFAFVS
ncbi:hypothetical protein LZ32DRAFT_29923 [Colletotrichum eremochloae]|nr:hypothetical protein LZ32DRAFT_29923 [Colletotrichum eremochloae]